ncbi:MAG: hypothetical protein VSS75_014900 [Candidatus Parabeggiatoa sp.]|nr:hypothetical protein [Candidatus Parabeggiatoa sp.]
MELTSTEINKLIQKSGYPFELRVVQKFFENGFDVKPSYRFFDESREKDVELDLIAIRNGYLETKSGKKVYAMLQIGVECKDNSMPYVMFGTKANRQTEYGFVDSDSFYCQISTSRDRGMQNRFVYPIFNSEYTKIEVKDIHHQFKEDCRFYSVAHVEKKGKDNNPYFKLHQSDSLSYATSKLGAFIGQANNFMTDKNVKSFGQCIEEMQKAPVITIVFSMLAHTQSHFRFCTGNEFPTEHKITSVFMNRAYEGKPLSYIIDFVSESALDDAIRNVEVSFKRMIEQIIPWIYAER